MLKARENKLGVQRLLRAGGVGAHRGVEVGVYFSASLYEQGWVSQEEGSKHEAYTLVDGRRFVFDYQTENWRLVLIPANHPHTTVQIGSILLT